MKQITDAQLIGLYQQGNSKAFESIVNRYAQIVYRFAYKLVNNKEDAHDITQESLIKVWKNIDKFDKSKDFKIWVFTITKRTALDYLRKRKSISFSKIDDSDQDEYEFEQNIPDEQLLPNELFEQNESVELIKEALETISLEERMIILLHNGEEMTFKEISEILDMPDNTVKSKYRRALLNLRKYIANKNAPK